MKIYIASDHGGYSLKEHLKKAIKQYEFIDLGCDSEVSVDYPCYGRKLAEEVVKNKALGIAICGTGIGISISCNKIKGARCALCTNTTLAKLTKEHNNANILALGGRIVGDVLAEDIVRTFIETPFLGEERHERRICQIENE
ncbi:MAG: RpiB/LacA/LacB family sugar-phosphate isomerase [Candidatus Gracilibacteria bacterium]|jgi:ribose 5-phosphate isomerase B|nr:RpiB/LacA/LacB family sugar-phosphate isomerase [Candidatus Gracilibacteria bacterium]